MKKLVIVLAVLAMLALTATCAMAEGTLRIALDGLVHLDPNSMAQDNEVFALVYDTLFELDAEWTPVGNLVKEWEISEDGTTHTWHLIEGVTFADGTPLDAEVVKWNIDRKFEKNLPFAENIPFESCTVIDENTVEFKMTTHYIPVYHYLACQSFSIYNPAFVEEVGEESLKNQVNGSGMYVIDEYRPNDFIRLIPNENYRDPEAINYDAVEVYLVNDPNTRLMMVESGEVDYIRDLSLADLDYLSTVPGIVTEVEPSTRTYNVTLHNQRPPLDNKEVRQAFNYAIDKDGMNQAIFDGLFFTQQDLITISSHVEGYHPQPVYEYNPEKAMELLEANGLVDTNGDGYREWEGEEKEFVLVTRKGQRPGDIEIAEQVQALLGEVGINVRVDVMDSATYFEYLNVPFEESTTYYDLSNQSNANYTGDKEYGMLSFYTCNSWPGTLFNYSHYCNVEFDELYNAALEETTLEGRNEIFDRATELAWDDAPMIFLFDGINSTAHNEKLQGIYSDGAHMTWQLKYTSLAE